MKFFNFKKKRTPEDNEKIVLKIMEKNLKKGVNSASIYNAFYSAKSKNEQDNLGLSNNQLLNMLYDLALAMSDPVEDFMYGGSDNTFDLIEQRIDSLRENLTDEEKRS